MLPPVRDRVRATLLNLPEFQNLSTEQLTLMARQLPGGGRVHLPDRVTTVAFLLGTRNIEVR